MVKDWECLVFITNEVKDSNSIRVGYACHIIDAKDLSGQMDN